MERQEARLRASCIRKQPPAWKAQLEQKVPPNVHTGLRSAFCKGFTLVFEQGRGLIEKTYHKEDLQSQQKLRDDLFQLSGRRKDLRQMRRSAGRADLKNMAMTAAEGVGLGLLGIGLPDVVLFLGTLLRGVYGTAIHYGFGYESRMEQLLILKMLEASLTVGPDFLLLDAEVNRLLELEPVAVSEEEWNLQAESTANAFAVEMLLLKFIQGLPLVGVLGGAANPIYYRKIMKYAQLKYRRRYLLTQMKNA